jgi:hypothetical protein
VEAYTTLHNMGLGYFTGDFKSFWFLHSVFSVRRLSFFNNAFALRTSGPAFPSRHKYNVHSGSPVLVSFTKVLSNAKAQCRPADGYAQCSVPSSSPGQRRDLAG